MDPNLDPSVQMHFHLEKKVNDDNVKKILKNMVGGGGFFLSITLAF
jgi:hypothetical protein